MNRRTTIPMLALLLSAASASAQPAAQGPDATYSYDQRLSVPIPPELAFRDETGRDVTLGDYFGKRPIVFVLRSTAVPCSAIRCSAASTRPCGLPGDAGDQYDVLIVSFDSREKPELAAAKKAAYVADYGRPGAEKGFHFLTGEQPAIDLLTDTVGFRYAYSKPTDRFAHPTGVVVLTPSGKISRYFDGIYFNAGELGNAVADAGAEKIGRPVPAYARVLLLCYDYDPKTGAFSLNILNAVRLAAAVTVIVIAGGLLWMWRRERRRAARERRAAGAGAPDSPEPRKG